MRAPSSANRTAQARPIPWPPPVTNTAAPAKRSSSPSSMGGACHAPGIEGPVVPSIRPRPEKTIQLGSSDALIPQMLYPVQDSLTSPTRSWRRGRSATPRDSDDRPLGTLRPHLQPSAARRRDVVVEPKEVVRVVAALQLAEPIPGRARVGSANRRLVLLPEEPDVAPR